MARPIVLKLGGELLDRVKDAETLLQRDGLRLLRHFRPGQQFIPLGGGEGYLMFGGEGADVFEDIGRDWRFGGGEIRGTLIQVPEPATLALLGVALAGLGLAGEGQLFAGAQKLEKGVARLSMAVKPEFMTSWGTAHGGSILSLLDITLSMTARTLYHPPRSIMTIDLSVQFIGTASGLLP